MTRIRNFVRSIGITGVGIFLLALLFLAHTYYWTFVNNPLAH